MKKKILVMTLNIVGIAWIVLLQSTNVSATMGNIDSVIYSDDFFRGDKDFANEIKSCFEGRGNKMGLNSRPTSAYGINAILTNSDCTYLSSHGYSRGGKFWLSYNNGNGAVTYYTLSDVPKNFTSKLLYLNVCCGALTTSSGTSLASKFVSGGFKTAIGYTKEIEVTSARVLEENFFKQWVTYRKPASTALSAAKEYTASVYGSKDLAVTSVKLFGNGGLVH